LATHKSAEKRTRQTVKRRECNNAVKSSVKTRVKSVLEVVGTKDKEAAKAVLAKTIPAIAKAATKGAFHKKTASRKISRLTKRVNAMKG
jgi:small subunit ribosomal protein S20